jgi:CHASE3 domain sensor protein
MADEQLKQLTADVENLISRMLAEFDRVLAERDAEIGELRELLNEKGKGRGEGRSSS